MKELFKSFFSLCWFALMGSLISCDNCNRDYDFYYDNLLVFYALDKETEQNLLEIGVNRYNSDTFNIYTKNLKPLDIHPDQDGSVVFTFCSHSKGRKNLWIHPLNILIMYTLKKGILIP